MGDITEKLIVGGAGAHGGRSDRPRLPCHQSLPCDVPSKLFLLLSPASNLKQVRDFDSPYRGSRERDASPSPRLMRGCWIRIETSTLGRLYDLRAQNLRQDSFLVSTCTFSN